MSNTNKSNPCSCNNSKLYNLDNNPSHYYNNNYNLDYNNGYNNNYNNDYYNEYNYYDWNNYMDYYYSNPGDMNNNPMHFMDYGPDPYVVNIEEATLQNDSFRTALWTGEHLQLTLMSIDVGDDIGLEVHHDLDQFIRIEEGYGIAQMGDTEENLDFEREVFADYVIFVPAGKYHNLTNVGDIPIKLYSIYAPPEHPHGTVHETKAAAEAAEGHHHNH